MSARLLLGHARTRGSGAHNPRLGGGAPVPPPSFHFLRQRSQDHSALRGAVQVLARRPQISLDHYAITRRRLAPLDRREIQSDSHALSLKAESRRGSVGRCMDRTREHTMRQTRSTPKVRLLISVEGEAPDLNQRDCSPPTLQARGGSRWPRGIYPRRF